MTHFDNVMIVDDYLFTFEHACLFFCTWAGRNPEHEEVCLLDSFLLYVLVVLTCPTTSGPTSKTFAGNPIARCYGIRVVAVDCRGTRSTRGLTTSAARRSAPPPAPAACCRAECVLNAFCVLNVQCLQCP